MLDLIRKQLHGNVVFIAGNEKNSGKTTFLNYLLGICRGYGSIAFLTAGVEGEKKDVFPGNAKRRIFAYRNDYLLTAEKSLSKSSALFDIIDVFSVNTCFGKLALLKTLRGGFVELIGPEYNSQLTDLLSSLKDEKKIDTIFIDGAINRITQISSLPDASFVYVMKVNNKNYKSALKQMRLLSFIGEFPVADMESNGSLDFFECEGALTKRKLNTIPKNIKGLIVDDFTKIFLEYEDIKKLLLRFPIYYRNLYRLLFISINLYDIRKEEFSVLVERYGIKTKVIYNPYRFSFCKQIFFLI